MWSQVSKNTPQDSRDLSKTPLVIPSCSKMKSGSGANRKNSARGNRRKKRRAWTETTRMTATILGHQDTLGNVRGLDQVPRPHLQVCTHTKGSIVGVVCKLNLKSTGVRVSKLLQDCTPENTQVIPPRPRSRPCPDVLHGAPRMENRPHSSTNPDRCRPPTLLLSSALRAC